MSSTHESAVELDVDVDDLDRDRGLLAALRSTWYVWVALAFTAALTAIPQLFPDLSPSPFADVLFGTLTLVLVLTGLSLVARRWRAADGA